MHQDAIDRLAAVNMLIKHMSQIHGAASAISAIQKVPSLPRQNPCDLCKFAPRADCDGKPCAACPAEAKAEGDR